MLMLRLRLRTSVIRWERLREHQHGGQSYHTLLFLDHCSQTKSDWIYNRPYAQPQTSKRPLHGVLPRISQAHFILPSIQEPKVGFGACLGVRNQPCEYGMQLSPETSYISVVDKGTKLQFELSAPMLPVLYGTSSVKEQNQKIEAKTVGIARKMTCTECPNMCAYSSVLCTEHGGKQQPDVLVAIKCSRIPHCSESDQIL